MGTQKTDPDYEHSEAALREADAFDDWMLTVTPTHKPSDDSVTLRVLRRCWDDSRALERQRCASLCRRVADETRNSEVARIAGQMLANWISTGSPMADAEWRGAMHSARGKTGPNVRAEAPTPAPERTR